MTSIRASFAKSAPQLAVAIALLGLFTAGTYTDHIAIAITVGVIGTLLGAVGYVTVQILQSPQPNSDLLPHLVFSLCVIGAAAVLLFHNDLTDVALAALLSPLLGGAMGAAIGSSTVNAIQSLAPVPPTPPTTTPAGAPLTAGEQVTLIPAGFADPGATASAA